MIQYPPTIQNIFDTLDQAIASGEPTPGVVLGVEDWVRIRAALHAAEAMREGVLAPCATARELVEVEDRIVLAAQLYSALPRS